MDISTLLLIILIPLGIFLFLKQNKQKQAKPEAVKKDEIIQEYKNQMRDVLSRNNDNKTKQLAEKTKLLKKINYELSMNLFFDEKESKKIISELLEIN